MYLQRQNKLKIYRCEFDPIYPVGCCLVLIAKNEEQALEIAQKTIIHTDQIVVNEIIMDEPKVVEYLSGDY